VTEPKGCCDLDMMHTECIHTRNQRCNGSAEGGASRSLATGRAVRIDNRILLYKNKTATYG
jgi:hypothetical protein